MKTSHAIIVILIVLLLTGLVLVLINVWEMFGERPEVSEKIESRN